MIKSYVAILLVLILNACKSDMEKDISEALYKKLSYAFEEFEPLNKAFMLNINGNKDVTIQVVHRSYQEQTRHKNDSFGFALQITFPPTPAGIQYHEKFKKLDESRGFLMYYYENIPCYIIDLDQDVKRTANLASKLLKEVYGYKDRDKIRLELHDEGLVKDFIG